MEAKNLMAKLGLWQTCGGKGSSTTAGIRTEDLIVWFNQ